jgi:catechol 2,3-dioxygenase-like lactoylglutathione lyase family enzyme
MKIKHLDHINMTVHNFKASADWYQRVFGFEIVEEGVQDGRPWGIIKSGEAMLCMYESPSRSFDNRFELAENGRHGVSHFAFRIQDRKAWTDTVAEQKLEILYDGEVVWPGSTSWYLADPTGYEIEVALWKNDTISLAPLDAKRAKNAS